MPRRTRRRQGLPLCSSQDIGKLGRLKHVKIVTITAHRRSHCEPLALTIFSLPSPDVARVVCPRKQDGSIVHSLCGANVCPLLRRINTRKFVFRNLDYTFGPFFDDFDWMWRTLSVEEVAYFIPVDGRFDFDGIPSKEAQRIKLVFWEGAEPATWDWPGDVDDVAAYGYGSIKVLVGALERSMQHSRVLEIYGLETILRGDADGRNPKKITEQKVLSMQTRLQKKLQTTSPAVTEQLIFKTRQQYLREDAYGEVSREEKQRWSEEDAMGSASLDDTASSGPSHSWVP